MRFKNRRCVYGRDLALFRPLAEFRGTKESGKQKEEESRKEEKERKRKMMGEGKAISTRPPPSKIYGHVFDSDALTDISRWALTRREASVWPTVRNQSLQSPQPGLTSHNVVAHLLPQFNFTSARLLGGGYCRPRVRGGGEALAIYGYVITRHVTYNPWEMTTRAGCCSVLCLGVECVTAA